MVALRNREVVVSLHGPKQEDVISTGNVDDGQWHRVSIVKDKRKMILILDNQAPLRAKAPNKLQLDGQIFVGGLPENVLDVGFLIEVTEGFKGCVRNMHINGQYVDLASNNNVIHGVHQCFAQVEQGSYFPGDAFAIYSKLVSFFFYALVMQSIQHVLFCR